MLSMLPLTDSVGAKCSYGTQKTHIDLDVETGSEIPEPGVR
jgi:hypothetical protein